MKKILTSISLLILAMISCLVMTCCTETETSLSFKVSFDTDGGSAVAEITIDKDSSVTAPTAPSKAGYNFVGWYNGEEAFDFTTPITGDITLTAKWEIIEYTAKVKRASGTEETVTFTIEDRATKLSSITLTAGTIEYAYAWKEALPAELELNNDQVFEEVKTAVGYTAKVKRADGTEEEVKFTVEDRSDKLAGIVLTANDAQYTYSWKEALPAELELNNDQVFEELRVVNTYTITWKNIDGTVLETDENVEYGATPTFDLDDPTCTAEGIEYKDFRNWTPAVDTVVGNAEYVADYGVLLTTESKTYNLKGANGGTWEKNIALDYTSSSYTNKAVYSVEISTKNADGEPVAMVNCGRTGLAGIVIHEENNGTIAIGVNQYGIVSFCYANEYPSAGSFEMTRRYDLGDDSRWDFEANANTTYALDGTKDSITLSVALLNDNLYIYADSVLIKQLTSMNNNNKYFSDKIVSSGNYKFGVIATFVDTTQSITTVKVVEEQYGNDVCDSSDLLVSNGLIKVGDTYTTTTERPGINQSFYYYTSPDTYSNTAVYSVKVRTIPMGSDTNLRGIWSWAFDVGVVFSGTTEVTAALSDKGNNKTGYYYSAEIGLNNYGVASSNAQISAMQRRWDTPSVTDITTAVDANKLTTDNERLLTIILSNGVIYIYVDGVYVNKVAIDNAVFANGSYSFAKTDELRFGVVATNLESGAFTATMTVVTEKYGEDAVKEIAETEAYNSIVNYSTITWKDADGSVLKTERVKNGETPSYDGTPACSTDEYEYSDFRGWTPAIAAVTCDATYTANYGIILSKADNTYNLKGAYGASWGTSIAMDYTSNYVTKAIYSVEISTKDANGNAVAMARYNSDRTGLAGIILHEKDHGSVLIGVNQYGIVSFCYNDEYPAAGSFGMARRYDLGDASRWSFDSAANSAVALDGSKDSVVLTIVLLNDNLYIYCNGVIVKQLTSMSSANSYFSNQIVAGGEYEFGVAASFINTNESITTVKILNEKYGDDADADIAAAASGSTLITNGITRVGNTYTTSTYFGINQSYYYYTSPNTYSNTAVYSVKVKTVPSGTDTDLRGIWNWTFDVGIVFSGKTIVTSALSEKGNNESGYYYSAEIGLNKYGVASSNGQVSALQRRWDTPGVTDTTTVVDAHKLTADNERLLTLVLKDGYIYIYVDNVFVNVIALDDAVFKNSTYGFAKTDEIKFGVVATNLESRAFIATMTVVTEKYGDDAVTEITNNEVYNNVIGKDHTLTIKRENGTEETVTFNMLDRASKLASITLTADTNEYVYSWKEALPTRLSPVDTYVFEEVKTAKEYSLTVKRANGTNETVKFTAFNITEVLNGLTLTTNDAEYTYAWKDTLPETLALNNDQVVEEVRTAVEYTATVKRAGGSEETVTFTVEDRASKLAGIVLTADDAEYTYAWKDTLPEELALNNDQVFEEVKTAVEYTATVKRAGGSEETVTFTVEDRASKLAGIVLTADDAEYTYSWKDTLPEELALNNDQVFEEVKTAVEYSAKIKRADGTEETVTFTVEDRASKLAGIVLTADDAEYTYSWKEELPETLALNNDQVFEEVRTPVVTE